MPASNAAAIAAAAQAAQCTSMHAPRLAARLRGFWACPLRRGGSRGRPGKGARGAGPVGGGAAPLFEDYALWEECASAMMLTGQGERKEAMVRAQLERDGSGSGVSWAT